MFAGCRKPPAKSGILPRAAHALRSPSSSRPPAAGMAAGAALLPVRFVHCVDTWPDVTFAGLWPSRLGMSHSADPPAKELFMTALTSDIAKFVATLQAGSVPERCNFGARIGMLDCVGTMIAGADEPAVQLVARMV